MTWYSLLVSFNLTKRGLIMAAKKKAKKRPAKKKAKTKKRRR